MTTTNAPSSDKRVIKRKWNVSDIPDLTGKLFLVTGANSGLGFEITRALASHHATVIMAVRNNKKGEQAKQKILAELPDAKLELMHLDLASLRSIKDFSQSFTSSFSKLHGLINNAGVMNTPKQTTQDGFDYQFGINHLGHFALTGQLLPLLLQTPDSRVVTVSSMVHKRGDINFSDINFERSYSRMDAYAQSKLANLLFALELQRRLETARITNTISVAAHPGYSATNLTVNGLGSGKIGRYFRWAFRIVDLLFAQSAKKGALPILCAATDPIIQGGDYLGPNGFKESRGYPTFVDPSPKARDEELAKKLWQVSEELTQIKYDFSSK